MSDIKATIKSAKIDASLSGETKINAAVSRPKIEAKISSTNINAKIASANKIDAKITATGRKGDKGDKGETGVGLDFTWRGTELGIKTETDTEYQFINLRGTDAHYIHEQAVAESVWTVKHLLNKHPSVFVVDSAGSVVIGEIQYIDKDSLKLIFTSEFAGKAYMN